MSEQRSIHVRPWFVASYAVTATESTSIAYEDITFEYVEQHVVMGGREMAVIGEGHRLGGHVPGRLGGLDVFKAPWADESWRAAYEFLLQLDSPRLVETPLGSPGLPGGARPLVDVSAVSGARIGGALLDHLWQRLAARFEFDLLRTLLDKGSEELPSSSDVLLARALERWNVVRTGQGPKGGVVRQPYNKKVLECLEWVAKSS